MQKEERLNENLTFVQSGLEVLKSMDHYSYTKKDLLVALCLFLFVVMIAACRLTAGYSVWDDDPSAYMNEGIAISEGRFWEQAEINYYYHPSQLPKEVKNNQLIYVWGYPLLLAIVNRFVEFDRVLYGSLIFYKIPNVICTGLLAGSAFLFFRRRFSAFFAVTLSLLLSLNDEFVKWVNVTAPDLWLLQTGLTAFLLLECYMDILTREDSLEKGRKNRCIKPLIIAFLFGAALWYAHELRLNGSTIALTCVMGQLVCLFRNPVARGREKAIWHFLPYIVFSLLTWITERILAPATGNVSDFSRASLETFFRHCLKQLVAIYYFFTDLFGMVSNIYVIRAIACILMILCAIGFLTAFKRDLHLVLFVIGSFFITALLPYGQGIRYIFNILPILVLCTGYGLNTMTALSGNKLGAYIRIMKTAFIVLLVISSAAKQFTLVRINLQNWREPETPVYSEDAVETYRFIQNHIPEDGIIEFSYPRSLYLNTQRMSFRQDVNGHTGGEADYRLYIKSSPAENPIAGNEGNISTLFENDEFMLAKIS